VAEIGPVEYVVIGFPGSRFNGDIVPAMREVVDAGLVRIMDLAFVAKDADGGVAALEISDLDPKAQAALSAAGAEASGLLNDDDIGAVGATLAPDSSAMMIVWEPAGRQVRIRRPPIRRPHRRLPTHSPSGGDGCPPVGTSPVMTDQEEH